MLKHKAFKDGFDWWVGLNWKIRIAIPVCLLIISTILIFLGILWIWGWLLGGFLLLVGGQSKSEKNGYRF